MPPGRSFGQRPMPLIDNLKAILERYPDGGQILKELIQNADDAGASKVSFIYDQTEFGTKDLLHPELAKFQGPSILAYNDAVFEDQDWTNIENLGRSYKKLDPLKVGRFGLGFNAVYHLTDLPMILSGDRFGVLEPSEELFVIDGKRSSGISWTLQELMQQPDQFKPFKKAIQMITGDETRKAFSGTLFRFPLRKQQSKLSRTIYSDSRVKDLFDTFRRESEEMILFLNNVMDVEVKIFRQIFNIAAKFKDQKSEEMKRAFMATLKNKIVKNNLLLPSVDSMTASWDIEIKTQFNNNEELSRNDWKVTTFIPGQRDAAAEILELAPDINSIPQVTVSSNLLQGDGIRGKVFCCLPLPFEADASLTGLPVHVNGSFGLSDSRRDVKWTGSDQREDISARWNEALIRHILPSAYRFHLENMVASNLSQEIIYNCLPNSDTTKTNWREVLEPFYKELLQESKIFWTKANGGEWIPFSKSVFMIEDISSNILHQSNPACEMAREVLAILGVQMVSIQRNFTKEIIKFLGRNSFKHLANPATLRQRLKFKPDFVTLQSREVNLQLLEYCLSDGNYSDMDSISLLPVSGGKFCKFESSARHPMWHPMFLDSTEHPRILLPNLQDSFVDKNVPPNVWEHLNRAAQQNFLQLRILNSSHVQSHLKDALPKEWFLKQNTSTVEWNPGLGNEPETQWLSILWPYLRRHFQQLIVFVGLPIVPVSFGPRFKLGFLGQEHGMFFRQRNFVKDPLPESIFESLQSDFHCTVINQIPQFFDHQDLESCVYPPNPDKVFEYLSRYQAQTLAYNMNKFSSELKDSWCQLFAKVSSLSMSSKTLLRSLQIFKTLVNTDRSVEIHNNLSDYSISIEPTDSERDWLPEGISFAKPMVSHQTSSASVTLASRLGCKTLTMGVVVAGLLQRDQFDRFTFDQKQRLTLWILGKGRFYNFQNVHVGMRILKCVPFLPSTPHLLSPQELFHPGDDNLQNLFIGEYKFPIDDFNSNDILDTLRDLGLKTVPTFEDVLESANHLQNHQNMEIDEAHIKSKAIVHWLERLIRSNLIPPYAKDAIKGVSFLTVQQKQPINYPKSLTWGSRSHGKPFASPEECWDTSKADLVSSTMPVLRPDLQISVKLANDLFDWNIPKLSNIVEHLKNLSSFDPSEEEDLQKESMKRMAKAVYEFTNDFEDSEWLLEKFSAFNWVWNGERFSSPKNFVLDAARLDLRPYAYPIPNDLRHYRSLFLQGGAHENINEELLVQVLNEIKDKNDGLTIPDSWELDLKISVAILEWFAERPQSTNNKIEQLLVPVNTKERRLAMKPIAQVSYCDSWISDLLEFEEGEERIYTLHQNISKKVAVSLGIPSRSNALINAEELGFQEFGQHEPLTQRIKNILEEYPDEIGIFKEMIQNADDAGATEVEFAIDWRENEELGTRGLLDLGMKACNGSCLWSYNNAVFSEADYNNLQKLGGQTKKEIVEKIGRFGIGFNSVYHLTDVPSFVSGDHISFLDPYTTHLNDRITNKTKPGLKINFVNNSNLHSLSSNQLKPYNGLFGCKISNLPNQPPEAFQGTLFRLPFRKSLMNQSTENQMSSKLYNEKSKVKKLVKDLSRCAGTLLLFTQNVMKVKVWEIPSTAGYDKVEKKELLEVERKPRRLMRLIKASHSATSDPFRDQTNILALAKSMVARGNNSVQNISSIIIDITIKDESIKDQTKQTKWLVVNAVGTNEAMKKALTEEGKNHGLMPCGGVAAMLEESTNEQLIPKKVDGLISCFLPLSITSGLPVHINGAFAVASNRKSLWQVSTHDPHNWRGQWNLALMSDAVSSAYVALLEDLTSLLSPDLNNKQLETWLKGYRSIFPTMESKTLSSDIDHLKLGTYATISQNQMKLFPILRNRETMFKVEWFPHKSSEANSRAFFGPLHQPHLTKLLIDLGFNLVQASFTDLVPTLKNANLDLLSVDPPAVIEYLSGCPLKDSLPKPLDESQIQTLERLISLIGYVLPKEDEISLVGLPLLLTNDNILRVFEGSVFEPSCSDLVKTRQERFVSHNVIDLLTGKTDQIIELTLSGLKKMEADITPDFKKHPWIIRFWEFLSFQLENKKLTVDDVTQLIPDWKLLPAIQGGNTNKVFFFPFKNSKMIVNFSYSPSQKAFAAILRKLNCWELSFGILEKYRTKVGRKNYQTKFVSENFLTKLASGSPTSKASMFTTSLNDYDGLCRVLASLEFSTCRLTTKEHETILEYFENVTSQLKDESVNHLKSLPIFETFGEKNVSTDGLCVKVINGQFCPEGMSKWVLNCGIQFLKHKYKLSNLYKRMGFEEISVLKAYDNYICKNLDKMEISDQLVHLKFLQSWTSFTKDKEVPSILHQLETNSILKVNGRNARVSEFHDARDPYFQKLLPSHLLLPSEYWNLEELFLKIGLRTKLSEETFLEIARDIATNKDDRGNWLLQLLNQTERPSQDFLSSLSTIRFIKRHIVDESIAKIHPQFGSNDFICFKNSVNSSKQCLVWTCANLLPAWATVRDEKNAKILGVIQEPSVEMVVQHCTTISNSLADNIFCDSSAHKRSQECHSVNVMKGIYEFLNNNIKHSAIGSLVGVRCVLADEARNLVLANQITKMTTSDLRPYLFRFPLEFGEFRKLFSFLGATEEPSLFQYSEVLKMIFTSSSNQRLNPEENRIASITVRSFFDLFKDAKECKADVQNLFLVTSKGILMKSNEMRINDRPRLSGHLGILDNQYEEPDKLGLDVNLLKLLRADLKPTFLSEVVYEKLSEDSLESCDPRNSICKLKNKFASMIESQFFRDGLIRMAKHLTSKKNENYSDEEMVKRLKIINSIHLDCKPAISTQLVNTSDHQIVQGSKKEVNFFVTDEGDILVHHRERDEFKIADIITEKIGDILKDYTDPKGQKILLHMLNLENPSFIPGILDDENVSRTSHQSINKPGDLIEDRFKNFLRQNPGHYFIEGELVGYDDDGGGGTCILAEVISEIKLRTASNSNMGRKYEINVGKSDPIIVGALDLYKFIRSSEDLNGDKDLAIPTAAESFANKSSEENVKENDFVEPPADKNCNKTEDLSETIDAAKQEIDEMLTEAWKLPEAERRKAIKRLYLRWHPDKSRGKEELSTEAFKHLMNQIESLERTGSINKSGDRGFSYQSDHPFESSFEEFFKKWNSEAWFHKFSHRGRQHHHSRGFNNSWSNSSGFKNSWSHSSGFKNPWNHSSGSSSNKQAEAKRWFRESRSDLQNAEQMTTSWNFVCFAAQQAAEKALKAVLIFLGDDLQTSHQLLFLADRVESLAPLDQRHLSAAVVPLTKKLSAVGIIGREDVDNLYERAKCPNAHNAPNIPSTVFTEADATVAARLAKQIIQITEGILG